MKRFWFFLVLVLLFSTSVFALGSRITPACVGFNDVTKKCDFIDVCQGENIIEYHVYNQGDQVQYFSMVSEGIQVSFEPESFEVLPGEYQIVTASIDTSYMSGHLSGIVTSVAEPVSEGGSFNMGFRSESKLQLNAISGARCLFRVPKIYSYTPPEEPRNWVPFIVGGVLGIIVAIWVIYYFRNRGMKPSTPRY